MRKTIIIFVLFVFQKSFSQDLTDGLLLHYPFNGGADDISGNNYNGTIFGTTFGLDRFGNPNSAAYFDGINNYINFPNIIELKPDLPVSFSFWINYSDLTYENSTVFNTSFEENVNSGVYMNIQSSSSKYQISYGDGSNFYTASTRRTYTSNSIIQPNEWHLIVIIVNAAFDMKIYVDCVENNGNYSGSGGQLQYSNLPGNIGRHDRSLINFADYFKGALDDFRYWDRELTQLEVSELFGVNYNITSVLDLTSCDSIDGSITISGLTTGLSYTINYDYQGVPVTGNYIADTNGEIIITGLDSGVYDNIVVIEDLTSCTDNLGQVVLDSIDLTLTISSLSPTACGSIDGSITISGLTSGLSYTINYDYQGVPITGNYIADTNGEIIITGLDSGVYDNIVVIEGLTSCTDNLGQVVLDSIDLTLTISSLSPTTCGSIDGSITISGLTAGLSYTINYDYQGVPITGNYIADTNGEIIITGLDSGVYDNIVVTEDLTSCTDNLGQVELVCAIDVISCFKVKKYFTPNNDGYNDFWSLDTISNDCTYILYIFDRYGKLLKTLTSQNNKWNGNYNGRRMPSSDYWFKLDYVENGEFLTFRSHFALKR